MKTPYTLEQNAEYVAGMTKVWKAELKSILATLTKSGSSLETIKLNRVIREIDEATALLQKARSNDTSATTISKV